MQVGANVCTEGGNWNCCKVVPEKHFSQKKTPYSSPKLKVHQIVTTLSQEALITFPDAHKPSGVQLRGRIPRFGCPSWQHFLACLHSARVVASKTPHFNLSQSQKNIHVGALSQAPHSCSLSQSLQVWGAYENTYEN